MSRLPLARLHRRLGARLAARGDVEVVAGYGRPEAEERAMREGLALVDRSFVGRLELLGADRQRFLNGLLTCDVKALAPGEGAFGFFCQAQGKILAEVLVLALADRLWLELPPGRGKAIADHLGKYLIADRVEVLPLADMLPLSLLGPGVDAALGSLAPEAAETLCGELPPGRARNARASIAGIEVCAVRSALAGQAAVTLWTSASVAAPLFEELVGGSGAVPVGVDALERARVLSGRPAFGPDYGADHFPQETGLEDLAVSYTKGCYLGQEVVARIHYRGKANRAARRLVFSGPLPPAPGSPLRLPAGAEEAGETGEEVGRVGSAVPGADAAGRALGIAVVHRKGYEPGTRLEVAGGWAEVEELPRLA